MTMLLQGFINLLIFQRNSSKTRSLGKGQGLSDVKEGRMEKGNG